MALLKMPQVSSLFAELLPHADIEIFVKPEWGANVAGSGPLIKAKLQELAQQTKAFKSSVSHNPSLGGFALLRCQGDLSNKAIGFDTEEKLRIKPEIARRVCESAAEYEAAPSAAALWCAKEAAFKSMRGPYQPKVLPFIEVSGWKKDSHFETFVARPRHNFEFLKTFGVTWNKDSYQFAIACCLTHF